MSGEVQPSDSAVYAIRKHWAFRALTLLIPLIVSSILTYTGATGIARTETAVVKDKAESGYQFTRSAVERLQERVAELTVELAAVKKSVRVASTGKKVTVKVVVTTPAAPKPPPALPADLDLALKQVQAAAPPPATEPPK